NEGINFGLLSDFPETLRWALIVISVAVVLWLAIWSWRVDRRIVAVCAGLLAGGALGNALDRLLYGAVADFLNMSCCGIDNPFAFNIADIAIFAGAIGLILFGGERKRA
ncbi:MAG: signal peptidase II, partial [Pseudomonadota bacterium]